MLQLFDGPRCAAGSQYKHWRVPINVVNAVFGVQTSAKILGTSPLPAGMAQGDDIKLDPSVKVEAGGGVKPEPTALDTGPTAVKPQQVAAPANGKVPRKRKHMYDSDSSIEEDEGDSSDDDEVCVLAGIAACRPGCWPPHNCGSSLCLMLSAGIKA